MHAAQHTSSEPELAGLKRRFGAIFYDGLLLGSVLFFATVPILAITGGAAIEPSDPWFSLYITIVAWLYFALQWRYGYTLGMKAWHIKIETVEGKPISWWQTLVRFLVSIVSWITLGAGFALALADPEQRTLHDRASSTRLVMRRWQPS